MQFLYPEFEDAVSPYCEGGFVHIGGLSFSGAEIVKLAGVDVYKQAFGDWLRDDWIPVRRVRKDELLELNSNLRRFNELKQVLEHGQGIPFIGSGMSCPSNMPTWTAFLQLTRKHAKGFAARELKVLLKAGDFEEAASRIFNAMPPQLFNDAFEGNFTLSQNQTIRGAVRLLPFLFESMVITTNFDRVVEEVYSSCAKGFKEILFGMAVGEYRKKNLLGARSLLKLHGTYNARDGRVLLKEEYERFYQLGCDGREELSLIFRRGGLVFLGCSLQQDRTMTLLKELAQADKQMPKHYAFLERPKTAKKLRDRDHFLAERNIFPIWYDGDHDTDIESLLVGLMEDLKKL